METTCGDFDEVNEAYVSLANGLLIVRHTAAVQAKVKNLVQRLRQFR